MTIRAYGADVSRAEETEWFKTSDYGLAGYLLARRFEFEGIERHGMQVVFRFPNSGQLVAAVADYTRNEPIGCRDLFHGLRRAKSTIQEFIRQDACHSS